jgi:hypothetical protein
LFRLGSVAKYDAGGRSRLATTRVTGTTRCKGDSVSSCNIENVQYFVGGSCLHQRCGP